MFKIMEAAGIGALRCAVLASSGRSAMLAPSRPVASTSELATAFVAVALYLKGAEALFNSR